jgi:3-deoxy-manno-octulosonate cytidylyltransferase (CMP-KDO synthetase)
LHRLVQEAAEGWGYRALLTPQSCSSGSERLACVVDGLVAAAGGQAFDQTLVINVQGDQPLLDPAIIEAMVERFMALDRPAVLTPVYPLAAAKLHDPNVVKVVFDVNGDSLYFSRSTLPFVRNAGTGVTHYRHLGIYGFQRDFLRQFVSWPPSRLEMTESLEQLRALENGTRLRVVLTDELSPGVDTLEQAVAIETHLRSRSV